MRRLCLAGVGAAALATAASAQTPPISPADVGMAKTVSPPSLWALDPSKAWAEFGTIDPASHLFSLAALNAALSGALSTVGPATVGGVLTVNGAANVGALSAASVQSAGPIAPKTDLGAGLGSPSLRFSDVHAANLTLGIGQFGVGVPGVDYCTGLSDDTALVKAALDALIASTAEAVLDGQGFACGAKAGWTAAAGTLAISKRIVNLNLTARPGYSNAGQALLDFSPLSFGAVVPYASLTFDHNHLSGGAPTVANNLMRFGQSFGLMFAFNLLENAAVNFVTQTDPGSSSWNVDHNIIRGDGVNGASGFVMAGTDNLFTTNLTSDLNCHYKATGIYNRWGAWNHAFNWAWQGSSCGWLLASSGNSLTNNYIDSLNVTIDDPSKVTVDANYFTQILSEKGGATWPFIILAPQAAGWGVYALSVQNNMFDVSQPPAWSGTAFSVGGKLTVASVASGSVQGGQFLPAPFAAGTIIYGPVTPGVTGPGDYWINIPQTVGSGASPATVSVTNATVVNMTVDTSHGVFDPAKIFGSAVSNNRQVGLATGFYTTQPHFAIQFTSANTGTTDMTPFLIPNFGHLNWIISASIDGSTPAGHACYASVSSVTCWTTTAITGSLVGQATVNNDIPAQ